MTLRLLDYVHPSLGESAHNLEYCVHRFTHCIDQMLVYHGQNIAIQELDLLRAGECAAEMYAMTCSLARANRSYCHGHAHGEHELHLAGSSSIEGKEFVRNRVERCLKTQYFNNDIYIRKIADYTLEKGQYAPVHPIMRNVF